MSAEPDKGRKSRPVVAGKTDARGKKKKATTLTKRELVGRISDATGLTKTVVKDVIQRFLDSVIVELGNENRVEFRDFGIFSVKTRSARLGHNPKTLVKVEVPEKSVVRFRVGRLLKGVVSGEIPNRPLDPNRYGED